MTDWRDPGILELSQNEIHKVMRSDREDVGRRKAKRRVEIVAQKRKSAKNKVSRKEVWEKKVVDGELEVWTREVLNQRTEEFSALPQTQRDRTLKKEMSEWSDQLRYHTYDSSAPETL